MLEGIIAACFYVCFYGNRNQAVETGAGAVLLALAAELVGLPAGSGFLLTALWLIVLGRMKQSKTWREPLLCGGTWLLIGSLALFLPGTTRLQAIAAAALLSMAGLWMLGRQAAHPLWMAVMLLFWFLTAPLEKAGYAHQWQRQVMTAALWLCLAAVVTWQQVLCARTELKHPRKSEEEELIREEAGWQKVAAQEVQQLQIFEHDFRHHLELVGSLYENGRPEEARAYIEDMEQARISRQGRRLCGAEELSWILMAKREECRRSGIQFTYQIAGCPQGISQMDVTALLLNLLDNAIRACREEEGERIISLMLLARGSLWQIELTNTGRYLPDKKPQPGHGIGLVSVKKIVEAYQGVYQIRQEGGEVVQKLILTGRPPENG